MDSHLASPNKPDGVPDAPDPKLSSPIHAQLDKYIQRVHDQLNRDIAEFKLSMLALEYHDAFTPATRQSQRKPLYVASRDEWVTRFRALVGPEGHMFSGRPGPGQVARLWRGTQYAEHNDGLSWTAKRSAALDYASDAPNGIGQLWRIDAVPLHAILYYDVIGSVLSEFLIDTTGLNIIRER